jgi:tetratricopeptide (TPR) repeat protein
MMERIDKLKALLEQNESDSFVCHALALEYVKLTRDEEAKALFQTLLARDAKYVGSYYHLAKLLERMGDRDEAVACYEKGMAVAQELKDNHAYNELQAAYEDLIY